MRGFFVCLCVVSAALRASADDVAAFARAALAEVPAQARVVGFALVRGDDVYVEMRGADGAHRFRADGLAAPLATLFVAAHANGRDDIWDTPVRRGVFALSRPQDTARCTFAHLLGMTAGIAPSADAVLGRLAAPTAADVFALARQLSGASPLGAERLESRVSRLAGVYACLPHPDAADAPAAFARRFDEVANRPLGARIRIELSPARTRVDLGVEDAARWLFAEANAGKTRNGGRVADAAALSRRAAPVLARGKCDFGLGWRREFYDETLFLSQLWHDGNGAFAFAGVLPRERAALAFFAEGLSPSEAADCARDIFLNWAEAVRVAP